jgi:deazaflavin-dependent oxidoreductase (nitroreductase family)
MIMSDFDPAHGPTAKYAPSPSKWVRDQVEEYESSGGTSGTTLGDTGLPVVVVTMTGAKSGMVRKVPLMRVEHDGVYAAVASKGGAPDNPVWYRNLKANPSVEVRDGTEVFMMAAREISGDERAQWWERCVAAFPPYAEYQEKTEREIPVFLLEPVVGQGERGSYIEAPED